MVYLISDTHFGHKSIIQLKKRPFESVEAMDKQLVKNWNSTVDKDDRIIHLGDVASKKASEDIIKNILSTLTGYKILILGNHDRCHALDFWYAMGFNEVYDKPLKIDNVIYSHEPIKKSDMPVINIHGHTHNRKVYSSKGNVSYICVSVEQINYSPVKLKELLEIHD